MNKLTRNTLAVAVSTLISSLAFAQESGANTIVVTGEKISRSEDKTLSSVEVITREEMQLHGDSNLQQVMQRTPGVYVQSGNEDWGIRGVPVAGFDDQGPASLNSAISVYIDDTLQTKALVTSNPLQLWDMQQVEVLRGAQSTNQGRNSLAGAVIIRSSDPQFEQQASIRSNIGNHGSKGISTMLNGEIVEDTVAARLTLDRQTSDGYITNTSRDEPANPTDSFNARGKVLIRTSEDADLLLTFARTKHREGTNAVAALNGVPNYYQLQQDTQARSQTAQNTLSAKYDHYLTDELTFTSITSATHQRYNALLDFDQTAVANQEAVRNHRQRVASQELRLNYSDEQLDGVVGLYLARIDGRVDDQLNNSGFTLLDVNADVAIDNTALFGEVNWHFNPQWDLIAGLRLDKEKNHTEVNYSVDLLGVAQDPQADERSEDTVLLPKLGTSYQLTEDHLIGLTWQKGYRSGGVNLRANTTHTPYDPEFTRTTELAWRGKWLDGRLNTKANLYHTDWTDQQVSFRETSGGIRVSNAADSRMQGVELSLSYSATPALTLSAGASYNDTQYNNFVDNGADYSGQSFLFSPELLANIGASYRFSGGATLNTDIVYLGDSVSSYITNGSGQVTGERRNDSATLVNINWHYPINKEVSFSAYAHNLFDKQYITNNQGDNLLDVGAPRSLGVAIQVNY